MGKPRRILLPALFAVAAFALAWLLIPYTPREPMYAGKPLTLWLEGYNLPKSQHEESWRQADEAVHQTGANAIPTLLAMLRLTDSAPWKRKLLELVYRQHIVNIQHVPAWRMNWRAAMAFKALGSDGRTAVPELIKLYEASVSAPAQRYTAYALANIGPAAQPAVPTLLRSLNTSTEDEVKVAAIFALEGIHSDPNQVVPALIKSLSAKNSPEEISQAVEALGNFGPDARPAIPALSQLLENPNITLRTAATNALNQINTESAAKADAK